LALSAPSLVAMRPTTSKRKQQVLGQAGYVVQQLVEGCGG